MNEIETALSKARQAITLMQSIDTVPEAESLVRDVVELLETVAPKGEGA